MARNITILFATITIGFVIRQLLLLDTNKPALLPVHHQDALSLHEDSAAPLHNAGHLLHIVDLRHQSLCPLDVYHLPLLLHHQSEPQCYYLDNCCFPSSQLTARDISGCCTACPIPHGCQCSTSQGGALCPSPTIPHCPTSPPGAFCASPISPNKVLSLIHLQPVAPGQHQGQVAHHNRVRLGQHQGQVAHLDPVRLGQHQGQVAHRDPVRLGQHQGQVALSHHPDTILLGQPQDQFAHLLYLYLKMGEININMMRQLLTEQSKTLLSEVKSEINSQVAIQHTKVAVQLHFSLLLLNKFQNSE